jgi:hypothetical protein
MMVAEDYLQKGDDYYFSFILVEGHDYDISQKGYEQNETKSPCFIWLKEYTVSPNMCVILDAVSENSFKLL